jgi:anti-sigma factor RsiW
MDDTDSRSVSDDLLSAYVDGEGSAAERAAVEAWLRTHPDDAARVKAWREDREAVYAHFARVVAEPVPSHLSALVWGLRLPLAARGWALAAMAAGVFVLGGLAGGAAVWQWKQARGPAAGLAGSGGAIEPWVQRAALAHAVYVPEPRHAVEVKAQEEHLARWLTRRIDAPVKLFDLREHGFELVGGRLLPDGTGKSAQLMYQDAQGMRVTVYLRKPERGAGTAFRYERHGNLGMFYWIDENCGYAVVGGLPREQLLAMAQTIYRQEPEPPSRR